MGEVKESRVIVGNKPVMSYVLACLTLFHQGARKVVLRARGKAISRAVDVALLVLSRFTTDAEIEKVEIETERLTLEDGRPVEKNAIVITLVKKAC
ncbi:MAG: DNA-binding protein Alba [Candidatus Nezhaarchaeota archaeon]|nr:DNA-binding protein Alba [Candidatus Nezhaarchaeota archaeon]